MQWKCANCGFENSPGKSVCEGGCGNARFGKLVLIGSETGKSLCMTIDTIVGKRLLSGIGGEDSRYASEPQFHFVKDLTHGRWLVVHDSGAKNPTFLNGRLLSAPTPIEAEAVLTIGPERLKLKVNIEL